MGRRGAADGAWGNAGYYAEVGYDSGLRWAALQCNDDDLLDEGTSGVGSPDTIYFEINGSSYVVKLNGSTVTSGTDTTHSRQTRVGLVSKASGVGTLQLDLDNWSGGDIGATPPSGIEGTGGVEFAAELDGDGLTGFWGSGDIELPVSALAGSGAISCAGAGVIGLPVSALFGGGTMILQATGGVEFGVAALAGLSEPGETGLKYKHYEMTSNAGRFLNLQ